MTIKNMDEKPVISEIQPNQEAIIGAVKERKRFLYNLERNQRREIHKKICGLAGELERKYPKAKEYRLFHVLISGTPFGVCPNFDFPGDDSIVKIMENLYREYKEEE